jgi:ParB-like chromosome segregation protein Spo0J
MSKKSIYPIGSIEYVALFDTLLPNLSEEAYQHLKDDIAENGVQVPIITDEKGNILDGLHRVRAASHPKKKWK